MFSRAGVQSTVGELTFQPDELKGSEGVPTTFPRDVFRKKDDENEAIDEESGEDAVAQQLAYAPQEQRLTIHQMFAHIQVSFNLVIFEQK